MRVHRRAPLPRVSLRLHHHVGRPLGGDAAVWMRVEGMGVLGRDQPLLGEVREDGRLQRLRCPRHGHVGLPPGDDGRRLGDGGEPARLRPRQSGNGAPHAKRPRHQLPVRHEQRRLARRPKGEPVGHGEAPRVGDAGGEARRLHRLQGGIEADHRAAIEEVRQVAGDLRVGAVVFGDRACPVGHGPFLWRPVRCG